MELIDLVNSYNFSISNNLTQMVNFPTRIPDCDSLSPALLDLFISSYFLVFVLQWLSLHLESLIIFLSQFPLTFHHTHNRMPHFIEFRPDWNGLCDRLREVAWKESLNSVLLLLLVNIASGFRLELMYISLIECITGQASIISMVFSCLCCCHSHRNHFFRVYQNDKSSESKVKFTQASNRCKRVLKAAKLACANKTKE